MVLRMNYKIFLWSCSLRSWPIVRSLNELNLLSALLEMWYKIQIYHLVFVLKAVQMTVYYKHTAKDDIREH